MRTPKGWTIWNTGGNCTAFRRDFADARYALITATGSPECPRRQIDACVVGVYSPDGHEVPFAMASAAHYPTVTEAVADVAKWVRVSRESLNERARIVADASADAYSRDRYATWLGVARMLLARGYSNREAEAVMRSKWTRWAADASDKKYGRVAARDLATWLDAGVHTYARPSEVAALVSGTFPQEEASNA